jgi:hypothetical protein
MSQGTGEIFLIKSDSEIFFMKSESESSDEESNSKPVFGCDICGYSTESKHSFTWENSTSINMFCSLGLNTEESFNRHRDAKYILSNIDPIESPDHSKKLIIGEKDETCLDKNVALLHSDEC